MRQMAWAVLTSIISILICGCASVGSSVGAGTPAPPAAATAPSDVYIAAAPAAGPPPSLPQFLGLDLLCAPVGRACTCLGKLGNKLFPELATAFSGLETSPPLKSISDPANLESPSPAVAAAAKIKQEEDLAQQKISALNYLASIGCGGCYPEVEEAYLAALEDCTESVRYAAVKAIKETAGHPCGLCKSGGCCSAEIRKKLMEMSDLQNCDSCPKEPSARIRRLARVALTYCGSEGLVPIPIPDIEGPIPADESELPQGVTGSGANQSGVRDSKSEITDTADRLSSSKIFGDSSVEDLVAEWYASVDPALPLDQKKAMLKEYLANIIRKQTEQRALVATAHEEVRFHDDVRLALKNTVTADQKPTEQSADGKHIHLVSHQIPVESTQLKTLDRSIQPDFSVHWVQVSLQYTPDTQAEALRFMNELWRRLHGKTPNPDVQIDLDRLTAKKNGPVHLSEVPPPLKKVLATLPPGECSPVMVASGIMFIVEVQAREPIAHEIR